MQSCKNTLSRSTSGKPKLCQKHANLAMSKRCTCIFSFDFQHQIRRNIKIERYKSEEQIILHRFVSILVGLNKIWGQKKMKIYLPVSQSFRIRSKALYLVIHTINQEPHSTPRMKQWRWTRSFCITNELFPSFTLRPLKNGVKHSKTHFSSEKYMGKWLHAFEIFNQIISLSFALGFINYHKRYLYLCTFSTFPIALYVQCKVTNSTVHLRKQLLAREETAMTWPPCAIPSKLHILSWNQ